MICVLGSTLALLTVFAVNIIFIIRKKKANKTLPPQERKSVVGNVDAAIICGCSAFGIGVFFGFFFYLYARMLHGLYV